MKMLMVAVMPLVLMAMTGCKEDSATLMVPEAVALTEEAAGHYCQMVILEHQGPKAQVHLSGYLAPLWFSQVRDGLAYIISPEQEAEILVLYVNDMGQALNWSTPGFDNWIMAKDAFFVVGSDAIGGMGAPEIAPFGTQEQAQSFAQEHGGEVLRLDEIPSQSVLAPIEFEAATLELSK